MKTFTELKFAFVVIDMNLRQSIDNNKGFSGATMGVLRVFSGIQSKIDFLTDKVDDLKMNL